MGVYVKGAIKGTKYLAQAYKLGLKVKWRGFDDFNWPHYLDAAVAFLGKNGRA